MVQDIYEPLNEYVQTYRDRFRKIAEETFDGLASEASVDAEANRRTCSEIYRSEADLCDVQSKISWWIFLCVVLWIGVAAGIASIFLIEGITAETIAYIVAGEVFLLLLLFFMIHPKIKHLKKDRDSLESLIAELKDKAWAQMKPLNDLYDWDVLARMISKTVPRLEFDPYFTSQRLADLKATYGWDESFNRERSVIYSHSGLINGNPFVLCRTRKMEMGTMTYHGYKTISWSAREMGSDGKYHTVHRSQTLHATYTAPFPEYYENTCLIYANTAAPDLIFHRKQSDLASREESWAFKSKKRRLKRKSRDLSDNDYAIMTNEVFEVAFDTSDRNDNQQFALLFTPLAQENMLELLRDEEVGYGDDFDFIKQKMINTIVPDHLQKMDLDMNPSRYMHFDFDKAKENFHTSNAEYFHAIYFSFAPLLCVPMYQQIRPQHDIYGHDMMRSSTFWEHEALANFWGQNEFKHSSCVTDCILKTESKAGKDSSTVTVYAHGYRAQRRVKYVSVFGGDGCFHNVPVEWDEYLPVTGKGTILIKEDNDPVDPSISQKQHMAHIHDVLKYSGLHIYRRHIASRVKK